MTCEAALMAQLPTDAGITGLTPGKTGRIANATFTPSGATVSGAVEATYAPMIAGWFLKSKANPAGGIKIAARSEVVRSMGRLEIAMVLDTTGSMQGSKIANLQTAAKNFVTTMEAAHNRSALPASTPAVRIAVVPFSTTVKVLAPMSVSKYNPTKKKNPTRGGVPDWLDGRAQAFDDIGDDIFLGNGKNDRFTHLKEMDEPWGGCVEARKAPYDIQDTAPKTRDVNTLFTPFFWPDEPDTSSSFKNDYLADGTTSSDWKTRERRPQKYTSAPASGTFSQGSGYGAVGILGPNAGCAMQQVQRLTTRDQYSAGACLGLARRLAQRALRRRLGLRHREPDQGHRADDRRRQHHERFRQQQRQLVSRLRLHLAKSPGYNLVQRQRPHHQDGRPAEGALHQHQERQDHHLCGGRRGQRQR